MEKFFKKPECTISHRAHIKVIDQTLKDLRGNNKLMGDKTFVFAGDFRQSLPVFLRALELVIYA